ncbi:hypothetical protein JCM10213v2_003646 [Rhodosporidiobolus nylandii]
MASNETGKCCVCGRETTQKCSACAEANFSLFFCSREHQKLIWPVHKLVCGPGRCSPFLWPKLTKYEAEEAKQHFDTPYDPSTPSRQARRAWSTRACHLLIEIAVELMRDANTDRQKEKSFFRHNSYTSQRLNKHLRGVVLPVCPEAASAWLDAVDKVSRTAQLRGVPREQAARMG